MRQNFFFAFLIVAHTCIGCGPVTSEGGGECDSMGKNYVGTIHEPVDGATNVAVDAQIRVEFTGMVSDRYLDIHDAAGHPPPMYISGGFDGAIEWTQYALQPNTDYNLEIGWMCPSEGRNIVLDTASFTTAQ